MTHYFLEKCISENLIRSSRVILPIGKVTSLNPQNRFILTKLWQKCQLINKSRIAKVFISKAKQYYIHIKTIISQIKHTRKEDKCISVATQSAFMKTSKLVR